MLRYFLSHRSIQAGVLFFVVVVLGSLLFEWYVRRTVDTDLAQSDIILQHLERNEIQTAADPIETGQVDFTQTEARPETEDTHATKTDTLAALPNDAVTPVDLTDAFEPDDLVVEAEPAEEIRASPFGFGDFPEIPPDFPRQDVWAFFWELYDTDQHHAKNYELINRVIIHLWKEGGRAPGGGSQRRESLSVRWQDCLHHMGNR